MCVIQSSNLHIPLFIKGKARDVYDLGSHLLIVATDRISAFDVVLPTPIPDKGKILNLLSVFWFDWTKEIVDNHLISTNVGDFPEVLQGYKSTLDKRAVIVKKAKRIPIECVVRGYLSGSGWKEYKECGVLCGIKLPSGLKESEKLSEPIFTPATKADKGHDENISHHRAKDLIGDSLFEKIKEKSIEIYNKARDFAEDRGIIIADTKFEFGEINGEIILIDEILTPDSSRFWQKDKYSIGNSPPSFDKQFVRDYLESIKWDKKPPAPELPDDIVEKTREKYLEAYKRITGRNIL